MNESVLETKIFTKTHVPGVDIRQGAKALSEALPDLALLGIVGSISSIYEIKSGDVA